MRLNEFKYNRRFKLIYINYTIFLNIIEYNNDYYYTNIPEK